MKTYKIKCNWPDCGQKIEFDDTHKNTTTSCPACGRETHLFVKEPNKFSVWGMACLKLIGKITWELIEFIGVVIYSITEFICLCLKWISNNFIGLIGISIIIGTLLSGSSAITYNLFLVTGLGFGFNLIALNTILNVIRNKK